MLAFFNAGCVAFIPQQGSVGASGDLAPLSHLALALLGQVSVVVFVAFVSLCWCNNQMHRNRAEFGVEKRKIGDQLPRCLRR
jgi:hypothetical protein